MLSLLSLSLDILSLGFRVQGLVREDRKGAPERVSRP
jgi:hypothetical protein